MVAQAQARFEVRRPLDLGLTLAPLGAGPWISRRADEVAWATHTPDGPATLVLARRGDVIDICAWGAGAEWAASNAGRLCGEEDGEAAFRPGHPLVARLHRELRGMRMPCTRQVFQALVPTVLAQKVTSLEARRSYRAVVEAFGAPAPGPWRLILPPGPDVLARTPYWAFHRFGIERRRADVITTAARSAKRLEEAVAMEPSAARSRLLAFPGIGEWTAAKVAMVALGDADAVPVGDYNLPHAVGYALEGTVRSSDARMLELLEPFRGHRARVVRMITEAGFAAPRFGPRRPLRNFARS